jgi:tetratricopeptide (TPR) repeat protein
MRIMLSIALITIAACSTSARAAGYCGELTSSYGPFDYRNSEFAENLKTVEAFHFTPEVEKLIKGNTGTLGGDLAYTLAVFPNHTRALTSLARLALRDKTEHLSGAKYSVECYFNRAARFRPDDAAVRTIYGSYLYKLGRTQDAMEQFDEAVRVDPENATANYNLGLLYLQKKDYEKALIFAKKAETLGFPAAGLKNKLTELGKWDSGSKK